MLGLGSSGGGYKGIQVLLSANNRDLKTTLLESSRAVQQFQRDVDRANRTGAQSGTLLKAGLAAGAVAVGAGLAYATVKAAEFDKSMRNVNSLAGLAEVPFKQLEATVLGMSKRLPQSADTLAKGLYDIQSSGFSGAAALKVLDASATSASAGLSTTETAARAITAVLNAYGLKAKDAADVSDTLFQTVNLGVVSFDELAGNLGDVVGGAAQASVSIDQVGSAIAAMTLAGISGAESTTSLNQLLHKLIQPSTALQQLYRQLGYESGEAALKQDGLRGVMEKIRVATGGNITTLLKLFPEIRAARGALALMANDGKNYAKVAGQIEDADKRRGATLRVLHEQMKAASNQMQLFKNNVDAAAIQLGLKLLPVLTAMMKGFQDLGGDLATVLKAVAEQFQPGMEALGGTLENVWKVVEGLAPLVVALVGPFLKLAVAVAAGPFNLLAEALEKVTGVMADHEGIVLALAAALSIHLLGGVTAVASRIGGVLLDAIFKLMDASVAAEDRIRSLSLAMGTLMKTAAITAVVYAGYKAWQDYKGAVKETTDALNEAGGAQRHGSFKDLEKANKDLENLLAKRRDMLAHDSDARKKNALNPFSGIGDEFKAGWHAISGQTHEWSSTLDDLGSAAEKTRQKMVDMGDGIAIVAQASGKIDAQKAQDLMEALRRGDPGALKELEGIITDLGPRLKEAGYSMKDFRDAVASGDVGKLNEMGDAVLNLHSASGRAASAQEELKKALLETGDSAKTAADAADALKSALDDLTGSAMGADEASIKWRSGLRDLESTLKQNKGALLGNSKAADANRQAVIDQVRTLEDLMVAQAKNGAGAGRLTHTMYAAREAMIAAGKAAGIHRREMVLLLDKYHLTPDMVKTLIEQSGADGVKQKINGLIKDAKTLDAQHPNVKISTTSANAQREILAARAAAARLNGVTSTIYITTVRQNKVEDMMSREHGGFLPLRSFDRGGYLPDQAKIERPHGARGLVQWAESGTGGEAFIPMSPSKRGRSTQILAKVAESFGYGLESYADGGFPPFKFHFHSFKHKKFHFRPRHKNESAADYAAARLAATKDYIGQRQDDAKQWGKDRQQAYYDQLEQWRENRRLWQAMHGKPGSEGAYTPAVGDVQGALSNYDQAREARAQAAAQLAANRSKNPNDTAADFYKKPTIGVQGYTAALKESEKATQDFAVASKLVSDRVGPDVVAALKSMGEDGQKWVQKLATSTKDDMEAMADQIKKIQFDKFATDMRDDIAQQQQFYANVQQLVRMGHADVASRLLDMGYAQGGSIAAQAVRMGNVELNQLGQDMTTQAGLTDGKMAQAVKLAATLQGSARALGVVGLATASGTPVADVLGLLATYGDAFIGLPADKMSLIRSDQAKIQAGGQPSGLENGGIVTGSQAARGLYYRWAEPGSGGESLIPLGQDKRARALQIWEATGRMIGGRAFGGGGTMVSVAPGAVQVSVALQGTTVTPADVERAVKKGTDSAMSEFARRLQTGRR